MQPRIDRTGHTAIEVDEYRCFNGDSGPDTEGSNGRQTYVESVNLIKFQRHFMRLILPHISLPTILALWIRP